MKSLSIKLFVFILLSVLIYHIKPLYLYYTEKYKQLVAGDEIYLSITKSKTKSKSKKLLLGDSVGKQLFDNTKTYGELNSLACNGAITLAGQFFLINNYLNTGNKIDTLYLLYRPTSFAKNLDEKFTYHYFIKPFNNKEYQPYFNETVIQQLAKIPYAEFSWYPSILTSNWAPDFVPEDENQFTFLSPISVEYLKKIQKLAILHHFKIIIVPAPMSVIFKKEINRMDKSEITKNGFGDEFKDFFSDVIYVKNSAFVDEIHLKNPGIYSEYYRKKFIR